MSKQVVFLETQGASRGGLLTGIGVQTKEAFLQSVEKTNEHLKDRPYWNHPDYRFAFINGEKSKKFKNMTLGEFEKVFNEEDIERMGLLLKYRKGYYPSFLKVVYEKHGYLEEENNG